MQQRYQKQIISRYPELCDYLNRYMKANEKNWKPSQIVDRRIGINRFNEWLLATKIDLNDINWNKLLDFYRFIQNQGVSIRAVAKSVQSAKHALRWGIETGELKIKIEDLYTSTYPKNDWTQELPPLSEEFLAEIEPVRPGSHRTHKYSHKVFHTFLNEKKLTYRQLQKKHMVMFIKYIHDKGFLAQSKKSFPLKIRTYLKWLYKKRKIKRHPDDILPSEMIPKKDRNLPRPIEPEIDQKIQGILKETDDLFYKCILLMRRCGLRTSEVLKMEFNCISYDQKGRATLKIPVVKLGIERKVPLDPETIEVIKTIQSISRKNYKKKVDPHLLVIAPSGKPARRERYSDVMLEICTKLDVKKWINLHALRHTYATAMLTAGVSITTLKEMLGHKSIHMTLLYAKVTPEKIHAEYSEAIKKMNSQQIPNLFLNNSSNSSELFKELSRILQKKIDQETSQDKIKKLQLIQSRIAKLKMEFTKNLQLSVGKE